MVITVECITYDKLRHRSFYRFLEIIHVFVFVLSIVYSTGTQLILDFTNFFQGRFTIAAKHHITIAEIYESEMVDINKVRTVFTKSMMSLSFSTLCLNSLQIPFQFTSVVF